jgi:hypothetical protein
MNRLRRSLANENGVAMVMVVGMIVVLTILAVVLIDQVTSEVKSAAGSSTSSNIFQAAEAGINDYIAKMTEDPSYYDHCVAKGESTRSRDDTLALVAHSVNAASCESGNASAWPSSVKWTYPNKKDWWYAGTGDASSNTTAIRGYAYNLMITPPHTASGSTPGAVYTDIVSTGCKVVDPSASPLVCDSRYPQRAIEVHTQITTPADFQYMMNGMEHNSSDDVCWASTIYGSMYSTGDIYVCGATFYGNILAEGKVVAASGYSYPTPVSPSKIYTPSTTPDIRSIIKNKIIISDIVGSVSQVQTNAELNTNLRAGSSTTGVGTAFDDTSASAWRLNFTSNGNVQVWKCVNSTLPEKTEPYCGPDTKLPSTGTTTLPKNTSTFTLTTASGGDMSGFQLPSNVSSGTVYVGPNSSSRIDTVTYTGVSGTTLTGAKCTTCSSAQTYQASNIVSEVSGGVTWAVPYYNGPVPSNGAIYTGQDAIISWPTAISGFSATSKDGSPTSQVNGRVTVASATDIEVAGDVHYASEASPDGIGGANDDVLGLLADNNITFAQYAPSALWWRAATVAVNGAWGDYACQNGPDRTSSSSMTFVGTATYGSNTGCMHSDSGGYGYNSSGSLKNVYRITDDGTAPACPSTAPLCASYNALAYLNPPWFPPLNGIETVLFREVPAGYIPAAAPPG